MSKKYRFGFDLWGLLLFLIIMIPNFIWFAVPAVNDVLRGESITPVADMIASIVQVMMIAFLCVVRRREYVSSHKIVFISVICVLIALYYFGWILYYMGNVSPAIILDLCLAPSLAFIVFAIYRKNVVALASAVIFTICHTYYGIVNFIGGIII